MKKNQIFVRAKLKLSKRDQAETGLSQPFKWVNCDILDLTQESFNVFIAGMLFRSGLLTGIKDEAVEGESIELEINPAAAYIYRDKLKKEYGTEEEQEKK